MKVSPALEVRVFIDDGDNDSTELQPEMTVKSAELEQDTIWVYVEPPS